MHRRQKSKPDAVLPLDTSLLKPGLRLAVGLSGGADSVALLRALAARSAELGLVLHAAHLHHGLRAAEADADLAFCRDLAATLGLPFYEARVDTALEAEPDSKARKPRETIEEAARRLRYSWFRQLLSNTPLDAIATAHSLDDQAETVLAKFMRGAWTEGLAGIAPVVTFPEGLILRPLLATTRAEVEDYLNGLGQNWREDSSNRHLSYTRNRIRHELLPLLEGWNPQLRRHLAQMAELAHDEEAWWQAELARLGPQMLMSGRPVRGGGRSAGTGPTTGVAIDGTRLRGLAPALQRRLLRHAAGLFGVRLDFAATEALRNLALGGKAGQKLAFPNGLRVERSARELRLEVGPATPAQELASAPTPQYSASIPGEIIAPAFGLRLKIDIPANTFGAEPDGGPSGRTATLRNWKAGDRVRLRYSGAPRKVKEVLERLRVTGTERALWPVLEVGSHIIWMRGVELEGDPNLAISEASGQPPEASTFEKDVDGG